MPDTGDPTDDRIGSQGLKMPRFTIVSPCKNSERTISRAIASICDQTFGDFEYILVDGGSSDRSLEIAREAIKPLGERARLLVGSDSGIYDGMNRGLTVRYRSLKIAPGQGMRTLSTAFSGNSRMTHWFG
jgi:cellulose synthase/poly-beta-1,6-N-acetylglucosamine synthase-like glycosyltransferase